MNTPHAATIYRLGFKELWSLARDPMMLVLTSYMFTLQIYVASTTMPDTLHKAPIAIVDEDGSSLSSRVAESFYPPQFQLPKMIPMSAVDAGLDSGAYTFVLDIPMNFQRDVLASRSPMVQLSVDATRMTQAFTGSGYIQRMVLAEVNGFVQRSRGSAPPQVDLALRARFNPNLEHSWFGGLMEIVNNITLLSIILSGAALIREREHGTIEHLLVMPITPIEIVLAKIWAMGVVVLLAATIALVLVVQGVLHVPLEGSMALFLASAVLEVFATTALGIFMATLARSMPQFGLLSVLVLLPLQLLSGGFTARESMPAFVQTVMLAAPTTHFVASSQAILFRGAGLAVVWPRLLAMAVIGGVLFTISLNRFRKTISQMA
jgi:ABC-2 type transport system permease protein